MRHRCLCGELVSFEGHVCKLTEADVLAMVQAELHKRLDGKPFTVEDIRNACMQVFADARKRGWLVDPRIDIEKGPDPRTLGKITVYR